SGARRRRVRSSLPRLIRAATRSRSTGSSARRSSCRRTPISRKRWLTERSSHPSVPHCVARSPLAKAVMLRIIWNPKADKERMVNSRAPNTVIGAMTDGSIAFTRPSGRAPDQLREVRIERGFARYAEGSVLVSVGETRVLCTASVENRVPAFLRGKGEGWVTAEYGMLPRATHPRSDREAARGKQG